MYRYQNVRIQILLTIRCVITANKEHPGCRPKMFPMLPLATPRVHSSPRFVTNLSHRSISDLYNAVTYHPSGLTYMIHVT